MKSTRKKKKTKDYDILPEEVEEEYYVWVWQLIYSRAALLLCHADVVELVDTRDLKSLSRQGVWVQVPPSVPFKEYE